MDGCSLIQQYRYIKLPLIKNIFSIVVVMLINGCLKTFDVFYILDNKIKIDGNGSDLYVQNSV